MIVKLKYTFLMLFGLLAFNSLAQSPPLINYQAGVRRADGSAIANLNMTVKFEIIQGTATSTVLVSETQTITTNLLGLFSTQIGKNGMLSSVNWQNGNTFLKVQIDTANVSNFMDLGTQQFVSVPFAMQASDVPSTYTNNVITIGSKSYTLNTVSGSNVTITPTGVLTATTSGSSFTLDAPAPQYNATTGNLVTGTSSTNITPSLGISGNTLTVGPASNSIVLPSNTLQATPNTSIVGSGAVQVTSLGVNSFSLNVSQPTLTLNSNSLSINGSNTVTLPVTQTITGQGMAAVTPSAGSVFTVSVPIPTLTFNSGSLSINGGNTVIIPGASNASLVGTGAAVVATLAPNSYSINVPQPTLTATGNSVSISGGNTVTVTTTPNTSLVASGAAAVATLGTNSYSINVPQPTLTATGNSVSISGGNTVTVTTTPNTSLVASGAAAVATLGTNSYSINVPQPTLSATGNSVSISGGNTVTVTTTPNTSLVASGAAAVATLGTNSYSINVPQPTLSATGNSVSISGGNTVTITTTPNTSLVASGAAAVTTLGTNSYSIDVPQPSLSVSGNSILVNGTNGAAIPSPTFAYSNTTGSLVSGTTSANITPSLTLSGTTLTSGPASNSVNLNTISPWTQTGGTVALNTTTSMVGIGTNTPSYLLDILGTSGPRLRVFSQDGFWAGMLAKNNTREYFVGIQGTFESAGGVTSGFHIFDNTAGQRRMVIDFNGNMGVGNSAPTERLDVLGNLKFSGALMPNNQPGTAGQVLVSGGPSTPPVWTSPSLTINGSTLGIVGGNTLALPSANNWALTGNAGTTPSVNFVGTTDANDLNFRVNNIPMGRMYSGSGSIFLGSSAGPSANPGNWNVGLGEYALSSLNSAFENTGIGAWALRNVTSGGANTGIGSEALVNTTTGIENTSVGYRSLSGVSTGTGNAAVGAYVLYNNNGINNSGIGYNAMASNTVGIENTFLGAYAGLNNTTGSGNVFLGNRAGYNETGSNKLVIANSSTASPLLYGDFTTGFLAIGSNTANAPLQFSNTYTLSRRVVLFDNNANNDYQYYGLGLTPSALNYYVDATSSNHVFYAGTSSVTSNELMRIRGNGQVGIGDPNNSGLYNLYVYRAAVNTGDYGPGRSNIYAYRGGGNVAGNGGTSWASGAVDAAMQGTSFWGNNFSAGVAGHNFNDYANSAGVLGAQYNGTYWGALAFNDGNNSWGIYSPHNAYIGGKLNVGTGTVMPVHQINFGNPSNDSQTFLARLYQTSTTNANGWFGAAAFGGTVAATVVGEINNIAVIGGHNANLSSWSNLNINPGGGNVGINLGTAAPTAALHIAGSLRVVDGTQGAGKVLTSDASGNASWASPSTSTSNVCFIKDFKSSGTNGGTFTSGAWRTRDLNALEGNTAMVGLSSNQFVLQPGTYMIEVNAPAYSVGQNRVRLFNISDGSPVLLGTSTYNGGGVQNLATLDGVFTITAAKAFEIQHFSAGTGTTNGFGVAGGFGVELYTTVKLIKLQ